MKVIKLVQILRELHETKKKIEALVLNLNDIVNNDIANLQSEVKIEINKILDYEKDCS